MEKQDELRAAAIFGEEERTSELIAEMKDGEGCDCQDEVTTIIIIIITIFLLSSNYSLTDSSSPSGCSRMGGLLSCMRLVMVMMSSQSS